MFTHSSKTGSRKTAITGNKAETQGIPDTPSRLAFPHNIMQLQSTIGNSGVLQLLKRQAPQQLTGLPLQRKEYGSNITSQNNTGLPDSLKAGIESLSGIAMDGVRVRYNSDKPSQMGALAYTKGTEIHVAPGEEKHLPHEAWHVVQQEQGRVQPTMQFKGVEVNDNAGLEKEADEMGEKAALDNTAPDQAPETIQLKIGAKKVTQFYCGHPDCKDPSCHDPRKHYHYSQSSDPSTQPFLKRGEKYLGEKAMRKQEKRIVPAADDVRVPAAKRRAQRAGAGLHEGLPTDRRGMVAASGNPAAIGIQSGLRMASDLTAFKIPAGGVAFHTGAAPKSSGRGSTHTGGQSKAHDLQRSLPDPRQSTEQQVLSSHGRLVGTLASGPDIVGAGSITGAVPNVVGSGPIEAPRGGSVGQERAKAASVHHAIREHQKDRHRSLAARYGLPSMASPQREPMDEHGNGGGYLRPGAPPRPSSPVPVFDSSPGSAELAADQAAWLTAPGRHGSESFTGKKCTCGHMNTSDATHCASCRKKL